jgi:uncharacterized protein (TIGR02246 family)
MKILFLYFMLLIAFVDASRSNTRLRSSNRILKEEKVEKDSKPDGSSSNDEMKITKTKAKGKSGVRNADKRMKGKKNSSGEKGADKSSGVKGEDKSNGKKGDDDTKEVKGIRKKKEKEGDDETHKMDKMEKNPKEELYSDSANKGREPLEAPALSVQEVQALFTLWNDALATLDPDAVTARYSKDAVLLPTVSDIPRTNHDMIRDYFVSFLLKKPQGEILKSNVMTGEGWALDAGIYEFTFGDTGAVAQARYSFMYTYEDGEWKISHHHSSVMPEGIPTAEDITDEEVRNLFNLWNDALATLDPDTVTSRYAKNAVLLPTVSDVPRTTSDLIKAYFVDFLKKEPQGVILESYVTRGFNWAEDMGIYEFTMGATGEKLKARYTFVYVFEDGEWKISHHHSSVMPEGFLAAAAAVAEGKSPVPEISDEEVQGLFTLWNDALATLDPDVVTARYATDGILLPTLSDTPRTTHEMIRDYFVDFLPKQPQGVILESNVLKGDDWALDAGIYEFTFGATGDVVKARYSYLYTYEDGEWKISHHHSSVMPESIPSAEPISDEEVKGLFTLWNDALATLDPDTVAKRYAKNAVLLPTISDLPRTTYALIQSYFVDFLKKEPQGVIVESFVYHGFNWAEDVGVYEFTMGATGEKVVARYSFVYIFEDGEWKILHHHSSIMPEDLLA